MSPAKNQSRGSVIPRLILSAVFLMAAGWLWTNQQQVVDELALWQYHPSAEVAALADRSAMSDLGRHDYYVGQPQIDGTQHFNQVCGAKEQGTAILGCYNGSRIYIYDVKDPRLDGIKEVTAAHEMLHAAYQRMSADEKTRVNKLVEAEYTKLENNADYKARMDFYARTEPGERDNELHSVIGTEVRSVSPELEAHYKQYFIDRSKVVTLHANYQAVFANLDTEAKTLYNELQSLSQAIAANSAKYNSDVTSLNQDIQSFNARAARSSGFSSQSDFANQRADLIARSSGLKAERENINSQIAAYEAKRQQYNSLANESKQLTDSINSNLAPAPSV